jgi:hypothetical protein
VARKTYIYVHVYTNYVWMERENSVYIRFSGRFLDKFAQTIALKKHAHGDRTKGYKICTSSNSSLSSDKIYYMQFRARGSTDKVNKKMGQPSSICPKTSCLDFNILKFFLKFFWNFFFEFFFQIYWGFSIIQNRFWMIFFFQIRA